MLPKDDIERVADRLVGTADLVETALEALGIDADPDEVEDRLGDITNPIERCSGCDWWYYIHDLVDENSEPTVCESCR